MKNIIILTLLASSSLCFAEADRKGPKGPPAHIVEKYDTDGDGTLNETERATAKAAFEEKKAEMKAFKDSFDTDGDGTLNETEREAFKAGVAEKMVERFDADGDGSLNADELAEAAKARKGKKGGCDKGECKGKKGGKRGPSSEE